MKAKPVRTKRYDRHVFMNTASERRPQAEGDSSLFKNDPRWMLVRRIVRSASFARSTRLSEFLLYVCRETLAGRGGSLNERQVGNVVFSRPSGYDPQDDNIVRSHASRLRTRLEEYFREEGASESLRLSVPRGSYIPLFEFSPQTAEPEAENRNAEKQAATLPAAPPDALPNSLPFEASPSSRFTLFRHRIPSIALALVTFAGIVIFSIHHPWLPVARAREMTPSHMLWSQMFRADQDTLIVPADSSLVMGQSIAGRRTAVSDYADGRFLTKVDCAHPCDRNLIREIELHRYTSIADLEFAVSLVRLPEAASGRTRLRYARELQVDDLKQSNLILAGSRESDPWLQLIEPVMNFILHDGVMGEQLRVENRNPQGKEVREYLFDSFDPQHRGLATIAFLNNLSGNGNILLVQGFTFAGTEAAAEFVTSGTEFDTLLQSHMRGLTRLPHFEILLQTMDVNGKASHPTVLAMHVYK